MENQALGRAVAEAAQAAAEAATAAEGARVAAERAEALAAGNLDLVAGAAEGVAYATGGLIDPFVFRFSIFVLAIFVGYYVVWSVTPALHTPLMAVTNAISSVIIVGALLTVGVDLMGEGSALARLFGFLALILASINIFGGFLVTSRMLSMYKRRERAA